MENCLAFLRNVDSKENTSFILKSITANKNIKNSLKNKLTPYLNEIKKIIYNTDCIDTLNNLLLIIYSTVPPTKIFKLKYFGALNDQFLLIEENNFFERFNEFMIQVNYKIIGLKIKKLKFNKEYENGFAYFSKDIKICFNDKIFRINYLSIKEVVIKDEQIELIFKEKNMILFTKLVKISEFIKLFSNKNIPVKNFIKDESTKICESFQQILPNKKEENKSLMHKSMESNTTSTTLTISSPLKDIYIEHGIKGKDKTSTTEIESLKNSFVEKKTENNDISVGDINESKDQKEEKNDNKNIFNESKLKNKKQEKKKKEVLKNKNNFPNNQEFTLNTEKLIDQINDVSFTSVKILKEKDKPSNKNNIDELNAKNISNNSSNKSESYEKIKNSESLKQISFLDDTFLKNKKKKEKKRKKIKTSKIKTKIYKLLKEKIKYKIKIIEEIKKMIIEKEKKKAKRILKKLINFK
ncbi:hypothetical protein TUBRATIS_005780 [Tubulinosema ratisbonensis]|uniref:Uncharacterized protein n=1 Tax=Tubulinosema ratisbonensis TaxID=291195 RepID=A0A437APE4_9MICR|nr:hypothetical protein TUBRATIS_005780 [Tubulinosema ratisbonensis]